MTLDKPVRDVAREALNVETVPDDVVRVIEDDEQLHHLANAVRCLDLAERVHYTNDDGQTIDSSAVLDDSEALAQQRVQTLALDADVHPALRNGGDDA